VAEWSVPAILKGEFPCLSILKYRKSTAFNAQMRSASCSIGKTITVDKAVVKMRAFD
jgi:hypothetical protein